MVPKSRLDGTIQQASEWKSKALELQQYKDHQEAAKAALDEQEALKRNEFEQVINKLKEEKDQLTSQIVAKERAGLQRDVADKLAELGMPLAHARAHALTLPAEATAESITEWTTSFHEQNKALFEAPANPISQPNVGTVNHGGGQNDLSDRLASSDLSVRSAAVRERQERRKKGERI